jgi:hypothetical protein
MNSFDRAVAISQLFMLAAWEALGVLGFGWNGWRIAATWFVGIWSFNILMATAVRTYFKLIQPPESDNVVNINDAPSITEDDGVV